MACLFERTERPRWHGRYRLAEQWWTWSEEARRFLRTHRRALKRLRLVRRLVVATGYPIAVLPRDGRALRTLLEEARPLSVSLARLRLPATPWFLCGLASRTGDRPVISRFLSLLASSLNALDANRGSRAMFVPPAPSPSSSDFLLHSDLFPCRRLLLIYDQVHAPDWSGSLLLPWMQAFPLLREAAVPNSALRRVRQLLSKNHPQADGFDSQADGFDELFSLLYDDARGQNVADVLRSSAIRIAFRRGEGYLLDDRTWLHGRLRTRSGVTRARFRRLVF